MMTQNNFIESKNEKTSNIDIPESLNDLISSIKWINQKTLIIKPVDKFTQRLIILSINENKIEESLKSFERKIKNIFTNISETKYIELENLILSNIENIQKQHKDQKIIQKKKEIKINKYSQNRKGRLFEAVIIGNDSVLATINIDQAGDKVTVISSIEENNRILVPPASDEYLHDPYEFHSLEDLNNTLEKASKETIFSLYKRIKQIVAKYIDQDDYIINIISIDIVFSYFQDRFNTLHYLGIFGGNDNGKSSIGDVIEALGYRTVNTTDPTHAVIYRLLGNVEPGQITYVFDESERIDQNENMKAILKTGYEYNKFVTKTNPNTLIPEKFFTYCKKTIIGERPPSPFLARGVNDRILQVIPIVGNPKYSIKEIINPLDTTNPQYLKLREEIQDIRNELLCYRLNHFRDPINNIEIEAKRRDRELTKPYLQLFSNPKSDEEKLVYEEVNNTLKKLLDIKNEKKDFTFEAELIPILFRLMHRSKTQRVTFSELWHEVINNIKGYFNDKKPNEFLTEDYGTIYRNTISTVIDRIGVRRKRHGSFIELIFDADKLIKTANQFNIPVQTNLDIKSSDNNNEGYEGYEGFTERADGNKDTELDNENPTIENEEPTEASYNHNHSFENNVND